MHLISTPKTSLEILAYPPVIDNRFTEELFEDASAGETVVRSTDSTFIGLRDGAGLYDITLDEGVAYADQYFQAVAASIGGLAVPHDWVVLVTDKPRKNTSREISYMSGLEGYQACLGVLVEKLPGISLMNNSNSTFWKSEHALIMQTANERLVTYAINHRLTHGWAVSDLYDTRQFMTQGMKYIDEAKAIEDIQPILVDLDFRTY